VAVGDTPALDPDVLEDVVEALGDAALLEVVLAPDAAGVPVAVAVVSLALAPDPDELVGVVALDTDEPATAVRVPMAALTGVEARAVCTGVKATTV